jgi:hypothetical protein
MGLQRIFFDQIGINEKIDIYNLFAAGFVFHLFFWDGGLEIMKSNDGLGFYQGFKLGVRI